MTRGETVAALWPWLGCNLCPGPNNGDPGGAGGVGNARTLLSPAEDGPVLRTPDRFPRYGLNKTNALKKMPPVVRNQN